MDEGDLQRVYFFPIYPEDSKIHSDKGFVSIDNDSIGGIHWICFIIKVNKSYYFDSFGGQLIEFLLKQLPKPILLHFCKI